MPFPRPWWRPFKVAFHVCIYLTAHSLIALWYVVLIEAVNYILSLMVSVHEIRFFDRWSIRDIFDLADILTFAVFICRGMWEAFRLLGEEDE